MNGTIVGLQARIGIVVASLNRQQVELECVIDTGFEGFLTLPVEVVADLGLPYLGPLTANLADNSHILTRVHRGIIRWKGSQRMIPVLAMGELPLIGTSLLKDCHLSIDFCEGGTVLIDEIMG